MPPASPSERYAREGVPIEVSTLADWVGTVSVALQPLVEAIKAHVLASVRIHADDTAVPVLAKGKTRTGRLDGGAGRPALWWDRATSGGLLLLAGSPG